MPDYYSILWQALKNGDVDSAAWRQTVFARSRQAVLGELRARQPPPSATDIKLHMDALEAAIRTIQSEFAPAPRSGSPPPPRSAGAPPQRRAPPPPRPAPRPRAEAAAASKAPPFVLGRNVGVIIAVAVAGAVLLAGAFTWMATRHAAAPPAASSAGAGAGKVATPSKPAAPQRAALPTTADGDLPPGVDGGSTDDEVPFFFRRQPVFYRTTHPVGTVIVDKQQHFLYLVQPNNVAFRYGIGLGKACAEVAGLRKISAKADWPDWQAPAEMVARKQAPAGVMKGGPGNPLGARLISLDDGTSRIHGTNAPKAIGHSLAFGCVRLVNDDIVDLANRIAPGTRVVFTD